MLTKGSTRPILGRPIWGTGTNHSNAEGRYSSVRLRDYHNATRYNLETRYYKQHKTLAMEKKRRLIKIDLSGCKNMKEAGRIINYIADGKIKLSVEDIKR